MVQTLYCLLLEIKNILRNIFFFKIVENKLVIIVIQKIKLMTEEIKPYFPQIDFYFYFILFIYFVVFCSNEGTVKILKIGTP